MSHDRTTSIAGRDPAPEAPETCWLIEWPGNVVSWFTGHHFTPNAFEAQRFPSKAAADRALADIVGGSIGRQCITTEHMFSLTHVAESPAPEARQDWQPRLNLTLITALLHSELTFKFKPNVTRRSYNQLSWTREDIEEQLRILGSLSAPPASIRRDTPKADT